MEEGADHEPPALEWAYTVANASNEGPKVEADKRSEGLLISFVEGVVLELTWTLEEASNGECQLVIVSW